MHESKKNLDIEILRAFAVVFTMVQHINVFTTPDGLAAYVERNFLSFGTGVDLFFAISGYVITKSLVRALGWRAADHPSGRFRPVIGFWIRRAFRLLPSAWLWASVIMIGTLMSPQLWGGVSRTFDSFVACLLQFQNLHVYHCLIGTAACGGPFGHYWTLSLEEQFYWALPILWLLMPARLLTAAAAVCILVQYPLDRSHWNLLAVIRTDALAWGVLLARLELAIPGWKQVDPVFLRYPAWRFALIAACLFGIAAVPLAGPISYYMGVVALLCGLLVWVASFNKQYLVRSSLARRILVWIAARSYAMYLIDLPAVETIKYLARDLHLGLGRFVLLSSLSTVVVVVLADLNYRFLEMPLRLKGIAIADRFVSGRKGRAAAADEANPPGQPVSDTV